MSDPSNARRGLDLLLAHYPGFDLLAVDWMLDEDRIAPSINYSPWLLVTLGQPSIAGEVWARHRFAIWKTTGAVHGHLLDGSVTDDALYLPEET